MARKKTRTAARRWSIRIGFAVVIAIVLLFAASVAALLLIDTGALKARIEQQVEARTGREFRIAGPLNLSIFPWLGFELEGARLANAKGFGERPFAALKHAELRVRIVPLFRREVVLDTVVLEGLRLNLARNAQGETNWAGLVGAKPPPRSDAQPEPPPETGTEPPAGEPPAEQPDGEPGGPRLRIEGIQVRDARFAWRDAVTDRTVILRGVDLTTGPLAPDRPTPIELSGTLTTAEGLKVAFDAGTTLRYHPDGPRAALQGLAIELTARGEALPGGTAQARLQADLHLDAGAGRLAIEPLRIEVAETAVANGAITARFGEAQPSFDGRVAIEPFSPRTLADALGWTVPEGIADGALQTMGLKLRFSGTPEAIEVPELQATLDKTQLNGQLQARLGDTPSADFTLHIDGIKLDRYLPAGGDAGGGGKDKPAPAADPVATLPLDALRGTEAQGRITIGQLGWHGLDLNEVHVEIRLRDGILELVRGDLRVAGGAIQTSGRLDARTAKPALRLDANLSAVQAEPLVQAWLDSTPLTGQLDASMALDTRGATLDAWVDALDGELSAAFTDGAVTGFDLARRLRLAAARLLDESVAANDEPRRTEFSNLRFAATIENGTLRADNLDLRTPVFRVTGDGRIDLAQLSLDLSAKVKITDTLGIGGSDLRGLTVPLHLSGPLTSPDIELALAEALEARATEAVKQELQEQGESTEQRARQEIEEDVEETTDELQHQIKEELEGLFK